MAQAVVLAQLAGDSSPPAVKALFFPVLVSTLAFIVLLRYFFPRGRGETSSSEQEKKKPPPSPPALPLIGHLHLVGAHPQVSMRRLAAQHGDLMLLRLGSVPTLVTSSPRAAQAVLRTHDQSLASRPSSIFGDILGYGPSDVGFAPYGPGWRQAKKLVTTHLLNAKKVQSYRDAREEEVAVAVGRIRRAAAAGEAVDLSEVLSSFTTDMVSRTVAGRLFREKGLDAVFKDVMHASMALLSGFSLENFYPGLAKVAGGVLTWHRRRKAEKLRDRWDDILDKVIDDHAARMATTTAAAGAPPAADSDRHETDFTDVLLSVREEYGITTDGIKGILSDMFAAGSDAGYLLLEFTLAELMRHPDAMARLKAEVRGGVPKGQEAIREEDVAGMPYLKAVIKETLRLHPPSPLLLPHKSLEECSVDGYDVPGGATVFVNAWAIGRDPALWDAPDEFTPERFVGGGRAEGVDFRGMDFRFLPFGSGRRMCPGMIYALAAVEVMLANLVHCFDWEMAPGAGGIDMTEVFGLTVHRKQKLVLTPKLPSTLC
ncbi:hypothetical protein U9M48_032173 [Paspalum notatum var. saurae]|uniref:Uncharacterized protein n=1 Tax=Paspalum notatum var. saurae TaxID=547442 RepID=A0AAQ3X5H0_PASNO